jgi:hypothetical protein
MSQLRPPRLPKCIILALDGLDWEWRRGSRHWRLIVEGQQILVSSAKFEKNDIRSTENALSHIRRYRRSLAA